MNTAEHLTLLREIRVMQNQIADRLAVIEDALQIEAPDIDSVVAEAARIWGIDSTELTMERPGKRPPFVVADTRCAAINVILELYPAVMNHEITHRLGLRSRVNTRYYQAKASKFSQIDPVFCKKYQTLRRKFNLE